MEHTHGCIMNPHLYSCLPCIFQRIEDNKENIDPEIFKMLQSEKLRDCILENSSIHIIKQVYQPKPIIKKDNKEDVPSKSGDWTVISSDGKKEEKSIGTFTLPRQNILDFVRERAKKISSDGKKEEHSMKDKNTPTKNEEEKEKTLPYAVYERRDDGTYEKVSSGNLPRPRQNLEDFLKESATQLIIQRMNEHGDDGIDDKKNEEEELGDLTAIFKKTGDNIFKQLFTGAEDNLEGIKAKYLVPLNKSIVILGDDKKDGEKRERAAVFKKRSEGEFIDVFTGEVGDIDGIINKYIIPMTRSIVISAQYDNGDDDFDYVDDDDDDDDDDDFANYGDPDDS